jgi:hypothetical protein
MSGWRYNANGKQITSIPNKPSDMFSPKNGEDGLIDNCHFEL